jgi:hypothetical protein
MTSDSSNQSEFYLIRAFDEQKAVIVDTHRLADDRRQMLNLAVHAAAVVGRRRRRRVSARSREIGHVVVPVTVFARTNERDELMRDGCMLRRLADRRKLCQQTIAGFVFCITSLCRI